MKVISAEAVKKIFTVIFAVILALLAIIPCVSNGANAEDGDPRFYFPPDSDVFMITGSSPYSATDTITIADPIMAAGPIFSP